MKPILDSSFRYRPSFATDVRRTFEMVRREQRKRVRDRDQAKPNSDAHGNVLKLDQHKKSPAA